MPLRSSHALAGSLAAAAAAGLGLVVLRHTGSAERRLAGPLLPRATARETVRIFTSVLAPTVAKGLIVRRPAAVGTAAGLDLDRRAITALQQLRDKYGEGPLLAGSGALRRWALILDAKHVRWILDGTPNPFAPASAEKRAALSHFQPKGSLISSGAARVDRRRFNEEVLDHGRGVHRLAEPFVRIVEEEAERVSLASGSAGWLTWDQFADGWFRMVRRVIFGNGAAEDHELSHVMARLRSRGNWAFLRRTRPALRRELFSRIASHLRRAEAGSLAAVMAETHTTDRTAPVQQVPQWLFAFDPAGMAAFRALALLAAHPQRLEEARREIAHTRGSAEHDLPFLRASVLESLRLWPTTPLLLRDTTADAVWEQGVMPAGTGVIIFVPFFHRDQRRLPFAHRFAPEIWFDDQAEETWSLVPFSLGPASCPGRNLVLLVTSSMLASLLERMDVQLKWASARLDPPRPLPGTLNHASLRFEVGQVRSS